MASNLTKLANLSATELNIGMTSIMTIVRALASPLPAIRARLALLALAIPP